MLGQTTEFGCDSKFIPRSGFACACACGSKETGRTIPCGVEGVLLDFVSVGYHRYPGAPDLRLFTVIPFGDSDGFGTGPQSRCREPVATRAFGTCPLSAAY